MSSKNIHLIQADHNREVAKRLLKDNNHDWACISAFYSALHYIEAAFFDDPKILHTHESYNRHKQAIKDEGMSEHSYREFLVGRNYPAIRLEYQQLRVASENARYLEGIEKPAYEFLDIATANRLVQNDLAKVAGICGH